MTNLTHNSFQCIYSNSLHVSSNLVLIIRRINQYIWYMSLCVGDRFVCRSPTQIDIHQILYWHNWFSWWWARGCSKHVENWNKYIEKNCASSCSFTRNHNKMHGRQNIKSWRRFVKTLRYKISFKKKILPSWSRTEKKKVYRRTNKFILTAAPNGYKTALKKRYVLNGSWALTF